ncbi:hypothetical protein QYE76_041873 [Lolium multiflorum]|uniref:Transposase (putative) gypsy type domain-containing protein n=1 Tax=Lolium multiflorum TaxID=4521 RepID=A0AAD8TEC8_LOLMU|nr:hypothetical protein QYE76_041873 [Lolium multiflorum]
MNLRRLPRRGEAFHRARFLWRFFPAAISGFLRRTSPLSVASPRRRPGACLAADDLLLQFLRRLRSSFKSRSWESCFPVDTGFSSILMSSEQYLSDSSSNSRESQASGEPRMETDAGTSQDAGSSSQASGVDLSGVTRGAWKGSEVTQHEIDWLYRSRRIPKGVSCRRPGDEIEPDPEDDEFVVFLAHFERGFGLPTSDFFRQFLDFYKLQPHHLPGNAIFYLSCYTTFMEAYMGLRPTRETFARFYSLWINSVQGKNIPKPKPPVQCGSCIIGFRQGGPFFKFTGLDSCRAWERTFFYVMNTGRADLINLPAFNPAVPTRANWSYNPKGTHIETNRIVRFMKQLMKDTAFCQDDILRTFISRRVLPLQRRAHKMSEMYGPCDPTKITGLPLSKEDVVLKAKHICQTSMTPDWEWGLLPLSTLNPPSEEAKQRFPRIDADRRGICRNRALDKEDPDPYIHWADLKMGWIPISRPGNFSKNDSGSDDDVVVLENAGPSAAPPAKRPKKPSKRHYMRREMPTSDGPALKVSKSAFGMPPESSEEPARSSPPPRQSPVPSDHRAEEDLVSPPENQDIGASNTGAETEDAGPVGTLVPTAPKKKKKIPASSSSKSLPVTSAPAKTITAPGAPKAASMPPPASSAGGSGTAKPPTPPPSQEPIVAKNKLVPPPEGAKLRMLEPFKGRQQLARSLVHTGPALVAGEKATGLLGQITELKREGRELGHFLGYAEKWNQADIFTATRGVGKDRLPIVDPAGPKSTEEHFMRLKRASTADARKQLFEELLWEHRDLAEAHSHCQAIPEASIEALKSQLSDLHAEKEQLIRKHQEALDAQKEISRQLKEQAIQAGLRHDEEMKEAKAAAEAKLAEVLEDSANANAVLRAELEEMGKFRKAAEDQVARLTGEQKEYDELVMHTDALALRLFPDSQVHAQKKVTDRRVAQKFKNLDAPWDPYDHLVALSARIQHMRAVDRHLVDLPDLALQLYKVLWPEEAVPDSLVLISDKLQGVGRQIREWQCSAARAGADHALRIACSWYEDLDLDSFHSLRRDAPTDKDPALTAKRKDRAYQIAESAPICTFIPPPPGVQDWLSEEEEEEEKKMNIRPRKLQRPVLLPLKPPLLEYYPLCLLT